MVRQEDSLLLGIDVGGSSVKVATFTPEGLLRGFQCEAISIDYPQPGWAEVWPRQWLEKIATVIHALYTKNGIRKEQIAAVGLSTMCPALIAFDAKGQVLRPAILYMDTRSREQAGWMEQQVAMPEAVRLTGNRIAAGTISATSMLWLKKHEPEVYKSTAFFGHGNTYLGLLLTGKTGIDPSNASLTGLFTTGTKLDWSHELCRAYELSMHKLPPIIPSTEKLGSLRSEAATALDLPEGIPVAMGGADTACSGLALGVTETGQIFETAGTSDVLSLCTDDPKFDDRFLNRCHVVPGRWLNMGAMSTPGAAFRWVRDQLGQVEKYVAEASGQDAYDILCSEAAQSRPGAGGVIFLPYLSGERSPIWDPLARGAFVGLNLATTRSDLIRAVLEAGCYGLRQNLAIAEKILGKPIDRIKVVGKGVKNDIWAQLRADITGKEILAVSYHETAVLGAAMLGGIAAGIYKDYQEGVKKATALEGKVCRPDKRYKEIYDKAFMIYNRLYQQLKQVFPDFLAL
ncbi:Xylulose kinase [Neomoorella glycerini]|uniref:Xylulose kinase n=1 Tax=Neomoorella glycerini TaxID=55779 RepID=A0A6I5ZUQ9_9FIRM|nr:FGGY family carbohydrate kinase [Moorella glycerini]QGP93690.1 Xylulose kinase [Moorella glycerini]